MDRLTENKIILVKRKTRLEELIARFNSISQAKFYVEHLGADFSDYLNEDKTYHNAISEAGKILEILGRVQVIDRVFLPNFIFGKNDLVIAIGQDGMVANTLKYLDEQLLIGVNPDVKRWDGILLPFTVNDLKKIIPEVFKNKRKTKEITIAKAQLNDGQNLCAVNDLFIGHKSHISARYQIEIENKKEQHSSCGIIVSTGLGSTGWLKSVLAGATAITSTIINNDVKLKEEFKFNWDANYLYFSVREPFPSKTSAANLVFGKITSANPLKVLSQMAENGVIFSDGIENDFLSFNSGMLATITLAEKKGHLVL